MDGLNIVGVQFRRAGRIYDFSAGELNLQVGDDVVVDTERGPSLAKVAQLRFAGTGDPEANKALKNIMRLATRRDVDETRKLTPEATVSFARERTDRLGLKMSVLQADVQFGGNKVIVYFSAPGRVDFRELVKDLATGLKARVELKQVGARDEAKLVGGLGICGREFCCSSFLRDFVPVSIKMAKNQNLALNPSKVSGGCGRLLCCLTYENDLYTELRKKLPPRGTRVRSIEDGTIGDVLKGDVLNQALLIETSEGRLTTVKLKDVEIVERNAGRPTEDEGSEAESWGEDLDFAALASLGDDSGGKKETKDARGGGGPSRSGRQERDQRPDKGERQNRPAGGPAPGNRPRSGGPGRPEQQRDPKGREPRDPKPPRGPGGGGRNGGGGSGSGGGSGGGPT